MKTLRPQNSIPDHTVAASPARPKSSFSNCVALTDLYSIEFVVTVGTMGQMLSTVQSTLKETNDNNKKAAEEALKAVQKLAESQLDLFYAKVTYASSVDSLSHY